jgi:precorrin-2 dehydrogenase / sirohydrochlorin ferrochelatase
VTLVGPRVAPEAEALAERGARIERRRYRAGEVAGFRLAIAATDDPAVNAAVLADGERAGVWVNAADDPANCSVQLPAVLRRGPMTVAVSSAGVSPALSSWLRDRIAELVGEDIAWVAERLAEDRAALHARGESTEGRPWAARIAELVAEAPTRGARP